MAYSSAEPDLTRALHAAKTCPFLIYERHCAGGDYCPFPPGDDRLCCFFCPLFHECPDPAGVCVHFKD